MSDSANNTELNNNETSKTGYENGEDKSNVETEDKLDEFGYEKTPEDKPKEDDSKPKEDDKKPEDDKDESDGKTSTGYGENDNIDKEEEKSDSDKDDNDQETKETTKEDIDSALEGLPESVDKEKVSKFALENKMTKEQMAAYVDFVKNENAENEKISAENLKSQRKAWKEELMGDSNFGGENFKKNVHNVDKILEEYMPNMRKVLTDRGNMLPPYIMKDLLNIFKALNPTTDLVTGSPIKAEEKEGNFLDEMYK